MKREEQEQPPVQYDHARLGSYSPQASERLQRCFIQTGGHNAYVNTPEVREWLFSCFEYPEQIEGFLSGSIPVPNLNLSRAFKKAADRQFIESVVEELRTSAHKCLPTHPVMPHDFATDPFRGIENLSHPGAHSALPHIINNTDERGNAHPIVISQMTRFIHEPEFSGDCTFVVFSRPPLMGPWGPLTINAAITHARNQFNPMQGEEFRVFLHHLPEHSEHIQFLGNIYYPADANIKNRPQFDLHPAYRPSFIDHSLIHAVNLGCRGQNVNDDERTGDQFARYVQEQFDEAAQASQKYLMHEVDTAHLNHTLRRMRVALHPYQPPSYTQYMETLNCH